MTYSPGAISPKLSLEDWDGAAGMAAACSAFHPDVEEEQIADEAISCYNCRSRRWAPDGILCLSVQG